MTYSCPWLPRSPAMSDAITMTARGLRLTARKPDALITALMLPILIMVIFVYLFGGAVDVGTRYVTYVVPGVLLLCAVTGSTPTAVTVCQDMTQGIVDRFRSLDVPGTAIIGGHVAASLARNVVSTALLFGVAYAMGFRPHATVASFVAAFGIVLAFVLAISWLCAAFGLLVSSPEAANSAMFLMFVCYASSALVPVRTMPSWLRGFAGRQPVTPITETVRALLLGQPAGSTLWTALAWCGGILVASAAAAALLFRRRVV
jgi:ABC-2 type transport system permease protein